MLHTRYCLSPLDDKTIVSRKASRRCSCIPPSAPPTTCAAGPATVCRLALPLCSRSLPELSPAVLAIPLALLPYPLPAVTRVAPLVPRDRRGRIDLAGASAWFQQSVRPPPSSSATVRCCCAARAGPDFVAGASGDLFDGYQIPWWWGFICRGRRLLVGPTFPTKGASQFWSCFSCLSAQLVAATWLRSSKGLQARYSWEYEATRFLKVKFYTRRNSRPIFEGKRHIYFRVGGPPFTCQICMQVSLTSKAWVCQALCDVRPQALPTISTNEEARIARRIVAITLSMFQAPPNRSMAQSKVAKF